MFGASHPRSHYSMFCGMNPTTEVHMMGWRSTLGELTHSGWKFEHFRDEISRRDILVFDHKWLRLRAMSEDMSHTDLRGGKYPLVINQIASRIEVIRESRFDVSRMRSLTPEESCEMYSPAWVDFERHYYSQDTKLIVDFKDTTIAEHMNAIMKLQQPKQDELRKQTPLPTFKIKKFELVGVA